MKIKISTVIVAILLIGCRDIKNFESILIKEKAFNIKKYSIDNRVQIDYFLEVPFQMDSISASDFAMLKKLGWKLCSEDGYDWHTYYDMTTNSWISDKVIRFYIDTNMNSNKFLTIAMRHQEKIKFNFSSIYKQKVIILYDVYPDTMISESIELGSDISKCLNK